VLWPRPEVAAFAAIVDPVSECIRRKTPLHPSLYLERYPLAYQAGPRQRFLLASNAPAACQAAPPEHAAAPPEHAAAPALLLLPLPLVGFRSTPLPASSLNGFQLQLMPDTATAP